MTQSSTLGTEHTQSTDRATPDIAGSGKVQLSFNPMHPSMELPPEQLIRLLGVETKKTRKARQVQDPIATGSDIAQPKPFIAADNISSRPTPARDGAISKRPAARTAALITALLGSIGVIAYLVLAGGQQQESVEALTSKTTAPEPVAAHHNDTQGQAAISAELERLRNAAEQRFKQRMAEHSIDSKPAGQSAGVDASASTTENSGADTALMEDSQADQEENPALDAAPAFLPAAAPGADHPPIE